jgi:hypothetical protein
MRRPSRRSTDWSVPVEITIVNGEVLFQHGK